MLAAEILNNLAKFPHCILLTRVGQFYEVRRDPLYLNGLRSTVSAPVLF